MNYNFLFIILFTFILYGCEQPLNKSKKLDIDIEKKYSNIGFSLIYDENLNNIKKLDDRSLDIYHNILKRKSSVKIKVKR